MILVDTAVVGAGPAGAAAAHRLAAGGHDVALIDKATFPRDKFCGDGLTTLCLRELDEMGFSPRSLPSFAEVHGATIRSPEGTVHDIPLPEGPGLFAAVVKRSEFDDALFDYAVSAGATPYLGHKVTLLSMGPTE